MNRLREHNNKFEVLITPNYTTNPSNELILGNWLDETMTKYSVKIFNSSENAMEEAFNHPDINWNKLVSLHKDVYYRIKSLIQEYLDYNKSVSEFKSVILTPQQLKNVMFDRVLNSNKRFTLYYNLNDVMCFDIVNLYTANLNRISDILLNIPELNIVKIIKTHSHIKLIGMSDINTTYEIRLWTTVIYHFIYWLYINNLNPQDYKEQFNNSIQQQKQMDKSMYNVQ